MNVTPGRHGVAITANDSRASILLDAPSRGAMSPQIPSTPCYSWKHLGSPRGVASSAAGGARLLIMYMRLGGVTAASQSNYRLP
ncbi:hypothetical protein BDN67DRAFT_1016819 [Paxillus ammoniavirescens]|nr:hypothetical protein BDN67DRAFT_1016819 [Paxillus ammoniavirescens]